MASGGNVNTSGGASSGGASSGGSGSGSAPNSGGAASGGATSSGGAGDAGSGGGGSQTELGNGLMEGKDESSERYETAHISRSGVDYVLITNGWGPGFQSHTIAWEGTSFLVKSTEGSSGAMGQPASYPTVFCGRYSVMDVPDCGLPLEMGAITSLKTGWRWTSNGSGGEYNAAYDIWVGNGTQLQGYLMVWLHDPDKYQPAGAPTEHEQVAVDGLPGLWDIWQGTVNGLPIINWVRAEGDELSEVEFDVMDILADAQKRNLNVPGTHINAVAVGFEIWDGPVTNLETVDFYVDVN